MPALKRVHFYGRSVLASDVGQDAVMDLAGIGAISAAAVAAIGVPAALVVGRWTMRGALAQAEGTYQAALATAASNLDHWQRGVRRDACVQFLLVTAELDRMAVPMDASATYEEVEASHTEINEALHRATTAYYVVRLESPELAEVANGLLEAVHRCSIASMRWAAAERARGALKRLEEDAGADLIDVNQALDQLGQIAERAATGQPGQGPAYWEAHRHTQRALTALGGLTEDQVADLLNDRTDPVDIIQRIAEPDDARKAFLAAAHSELNARVVAPNSESRRGHGARGEAR
ncbi:hypothetical protein ACFPH6_45115 [Streptomyces xiangluensis]|uniref:Secreted protein n=1 Tax=Streptomyces xiangluensis TaxID=2665720 RepID=A0ABV8Z2L0_9ACTN